MASAGQPGPVPDMTRQLAGKSRQVASRLEEGGVQGVGDDLRQFARRQPGLFLAAAGLAGFVVTRTLRNAQGSRELAAQAAAPFTTRTGGDGATPVQQLDVGPAGRDARCPETVP